MAEIVLVQFNIQLIIKNLAQAGDQLSMSELLEWLEEIGCRDQGNGWWLCEEIALDSFTRSEIKRTRRV